MKRSRRDLTPFVIPLIVLVVAVLAILMITNGSQWDIAERSQINPQANLFGQAVGAAYTDLFAPNKDFFTDDTLMTIETEDVNGVTFDFSIEIDAPSLGEMYVYKTAYYADDSATSWDDFALEADSSESQDGAWNDSWIRGNAAANFAITDGGWEDPGYVIAYVCMEQYKPDLYDILTNQEEDKVDPLFGDYDYAFICGVKSLSSSELDDDYWHIETFTVRDDCTESNATVCGSRVCGSVLDSCGDSRFCGECSSGTCNSSGQCAGCSDTRSNATVCDSSECDFIKDNCNVDRYCGGCTDGICVDNLCEDYECTPATVDADCDTPTGHDDSCVIKACNNNECSVVNKTNGEPCSTAILSENNATCQDGVCTECADPCKPQDYACGTDVPDTTCATCDMKGTNCATSGETCNTNTWVCEVGCTPACYDNVCGPDGCGGTCSPGCSGTDTCTAGQCVPACTPVTEVCNNIDDDCDGIIDNGIDMCTSPQFCSAGQCICPNSCTPSDYPKCEWFGGGSNYYYSYKDCVLQNGCYVVEELEICDAGEVCTPATGCGSPPPTADPDTDPAACLAAMDMTTQPAANPPDQLAFDNGINFIGDWPAGAEGTGNCCGDDANEWYLYKDGDPSQNSCCNNENDCVDENRACQTHNHLYSNDGDQEYCFYGWWYNCNAQSACLAHNAGVTDASYECYHDEDTNTYSFLPYADTDVCGDGIDNDCDGQVDNGCSPPNLWVYSVGSGAVNGGQPSSLSMTICSDSPTINPLDYTNTAEILYSSTGSNSGTKTMQTYSTSHSISTAVIGSACPPDQQTLVYTPSFSSEDDFVAVRFSVDANDELSESDEDDNTEVYTLAMDTYYANHCGGHGEWPCDDNNPTEGKLCFDTTPDACGASCGGSFQLCPDGGCWNSCS